MKRVLIGTIFAFVIMLVWFSDLYTYLTLEAIQTHSDYLHAFVREHYMFSVLLFIIAYIGVALLFLPLASFMSLLSGFLFGTILGAFYTNIGATIGALGAFLMVRYLIGSWLQNRYQEHLVLFNHALQKAPGNYLLLSHFVMVIPFAMINILAGLTQVSVWTFVWTTSLGIIPGSIVCAFAGNQIQTINSWHDIFSYPVVMAFMLLACLVLLPTIIPILPKK